MAGPSRSLLCTRSLASCRKSRNEASHRPRRSGALALIGHGAERPDWLAEDAVSCELVSAPNSLLTGKLTGNFAQYGLPWRFSGLMSGPIQQVTAESSTQRNRELSNAQQRIFLEEQGWSKSMFAPYPAAHSTGQRDCGLTLARAASFGASSRQCAWTSARSIVVSLRSSIRIRPSTIEVSTLSPLAVYTRL